MNVKRKEATFRTSLSHYAQGKSARELRVDRTGLLSSMNIQHAGVSVLPVAFISHHPDEGKQDQARLGWYKHHSLLLLYVITCDHAAINQHEQACTCGLCSRPSGPSA